MVVNCVDFKAAGGLFFLQKGVRIFLALHQLSTSGSVNLMCLLLNDFFFLLLHFTACVCTGIVCVCVYELENQRVM